MPPSRTSRPSSRTSPSSRRSAAPARPPWGGPSRPGGAVSGARGGARGGAPGRRGEPLYRRVAAHAARWHERFGTVGLVVGATAPSELAAVRGGAPGLAFLVPRV